MRQMRKIWGVDLLLVYEVDPHTTHLHIRMVSLAYSMDILPVEMHLGGSKPYSCANDGRETALRISPDVRQL